MNYWRNLRCDGCSMNCRYRDFKIYDRYGFQEVRNSLWVDSDNSEKWKYKRRRTVLGIMHITKRALWEEYTDICQACGGMDNEDQK